MGNSGLEPEWGFPRERKAGQETVQDWLVRVMLAGSGL